jgi:hypothetical protein
VAEGKQHEDFVTLVSDLDDVRSASSDAEAETFVQLDRFVVGTPDAGSIGFVSSCLARLDAAVTAAGFEEELKAALREAESVSDVLGTVETPAPLTATGAVAERTEDCANPHVYTVRTRRVCTRDPEDTGPSRDLVWYGAAGTRTKKAISAFGILDGYHGILVRDDFGGYVS